jgi:hypothetical protein
VIAPGIAMIDLDPEQVAAVTRLIGARNRQHDEIHVLHDGGRVIRAIRTSTPGPGAARLATLDLGDDLLTAAHALRQEHGVERVVLVDRQELVDLGPALAAAGPGDVDQPTMLRRSAAVFWSSPAVVTDPAPPIDPWPPVETWLQGLPSVATVFVAALEEDSIRLALELRIEDGRLARVWSANAMDANGALDRLDRADAGAVVTWEQVVDAASQTDPWSAMMAWADDARTLGWRGNGES